MEYKIFGPGGEPPDDFREDIEAFHRLDDQQRGAIAEWFLSASSYELYGPSLPPNIVASTLLPEQFRRAAGFIRDMLNRWYQHRLDLADFESPDQLGTAVDFLRSVSPVKERVWADGRAGSERVIALPTIDNVDELHLFRRRSWILTHVFEARFSSRPRIRGAAVLHATTGSCRSVS